MRVPCPCSSLAQGATSGVIDSAAQTVATEGLFFLERTKAIMMSYLAGLIKGAIPPYYSYYREDASKVTVQEVVGFLYKAIKDPEWMKIQQTMDTLETLSMQRRVPQYLLWVSLATPGELEAVKEEMYQYFELDNGKSVTKDLVENVLGINLSKVGTYLVWGLVGYGVVLVLPPVLGAVRSLRKPTTQ